MANQGNHGSNLPFQNNGVDQTPNLGHLNNLCPSYTEPDLNLHLSLGGGGNYYPILPKLNPPPSSSTSLSSIRGGATSVAGEPRMSTLNGGEEKAGRKMSWKKRAREANNNVVPREVTVAVPPPVTSVQAIGDSVERNNAFHRAIDIIKSTLGRRPGTSDGTRVEPVKFNPLKMEAPHPMIASNSDGKGKPMMTTYTQLDHEAKSPFQKAKHDSFNMSIDKMKQMMKVMPRVTTTGGLPNGRKIEGVLFRFLEGKVLIVCVCHGHFLSPEEFVQHAGGSDLSNCMRHIKVLP